MVKSLSIRNFRAFPNIKIEGLAPINLIVGDNAVGKTTLLESMFLVAGGNITTSLMLRQWRGLDLRFKTGSMDSVFEEVFEDLFHDPDSELPIEIEAFGEGQENRQLTIRKAKRDIIIPLQSGADDATSVAAPDAEQATVAPIDFIWRDDQGVFRTVHVLVSQTGLRFEGTEESLPTVHMFAAHVPTPSEQAAIHFSKLKRNRDTDRFLRVFKRVFDDVLDISVSSESSGSKLMVDVPWAKKLLPLQVLSGGTNRAASIMLAMAQPECALVLVDEAESGIYHERQPKFVRALVDLSREYDTQIIMSSHSGEWIENVLGAVGDKSEDVAFWRLERPIKSEPPLIRRFTVEEYREGLSLGEMR